MTIISKKNDEIILKLESGEELIASLKELARKEKIGGAWFSALGAAAPDIARRPARFALRSMAGGSRGGRAGDITLAFYDLRKKEYIEKRFKERTEILNITGNIAKKGGEIIIHAHGTFGKSDYSVIGGHIVSCRISATCEIYLKKTSALERKHDPKTGLNLLTKHKN